MATILNIQSLKLEGEAKVLVKYNIKSNFCVLQYWIWFLLPPFLYILQHFLPLYERQYLIGSNNVKNRRETKRQFCVFHENYWHFQGWPNGNPLNWKKHTGLSMSTWQILRNLVCTWAVILFVLFLNFILDFQWSNMEATSKIMHLSTFF